MGVLTCRSTILDDIFYEPVSIGYLTNDIEKVMRKTMYCSPALAYIESKPWTGV